ncbi:MAG: HEAT repeat domain-containing protein [Planctomycetes bacterium]|nr:HEAT repeat domain-containing protein [Planctomycetota bacterium]
MAFVAFCAVALWVYCDLWPKWVDYRTRKYLRDPNATWTQRLQAVNAWVKRREDAVPELIDALADENPSVEQIGPPALPTVIEVKAHPNPLVRKQAIEILGQIGTGDATAVSALREVLKNDSDEALREQALDQLMRIISFDLAELIDLLQDKNRTIRRWAFYRLSEFGPEAQSEIPRLIRALSDEDSGVRHAAARTLEKIGPEAKAAVPELLKALKENQWLAAAAADALARIGPEAKPAVPILSELLKQKRPENHWLPYSAARALREISPEDARAQVPRLVEWLGDEDIQVRRNAAWALQGIGPEAKEAMPALIEALDDKDSTVISCAARAMGEIGPDAVPAVPKLIWMLGDVTAWHGAIEALGGIGPKAKQALPELSSMLLDWDPSRPDRSEIIIKAIGRIDPDGSESIPLLTDVLEDRSWPDAVRCAAIDTLGDIGHGKERVTRALLRATTAPWPAVRTRAEKVLRRLDPEAARQALDRR